MKIEERIEKYLTESGKHLSIELAADRIIELVKEINSEKQKQVEKLLKSFKIDINDIKKSVFEWLSLRKANILYSKLREINKE